MQRPGHGWKALSQVAGGQQPAVHALECGLRWIQTPPRPMAMDEDQKLGWGCGGEGAASAWARKAFVLITWHTAPSSPRGFLTTQPAEASLNTAADWNPTHRKTAPIAPDPRSAWKSFKSCLTVHPLPSSRQALQTRQLCLGKALCIVSSSREGVNLVSSYPTVYKHANHLAFPFSNRLVWPRAAGISEGGNNSIRNYCCHF